MSNQLLAGFTEVKAAGGSGKKTPIVEITKSGDGAMLQGVLLSKRTYTDGDGKERLIASFKLIATTAKLVQKGNAGYAPIDNVPAGSEVTVFGPPASLARSLNAIEADGTQEVLVVYEGKKKVKLSTGKSVNMHTFKVGKKQAALSASADESGVPD